LAANLTRRDNHIRAVEAKSRFHYRRIDLAGKCLQDGISLLELGVRLFLDLLSLADYPQSYGANGTAVSLGSIPAAAVERIEVMSGGASAIYGSDAVAGVVNIITKTDFNGDTIRLRGGTTTRGGGDTGQLQWSGGRTGDRWSLTYAFERLDREAIVASQREFMDSYYDHPGNRADPASPNASISGVYLRQGTTYLWPTATGLSSSADALAEACAATNPEFTPYKTSDSLAAPNRCGAFGYYEGRSVQNGYGKTSAYLSGTFDFSDEVQGYAQVLANRSEDESSSQTHYYIGEGAFTVYDPDLGLVTAQRIFLPSEVGGIKNIEDLLEEDETFFVYNGDVISSLPLRTLVEFHFSRGAEATLALRSEGPLLNVSLDEEGRVCDMRNFWQPRRQAVPVYGYLHPREAIPRPPGARPGRVGRPRLPSG